MLRVERVAVALERIVVLLEKAFERDRPPAQQPDQQPPTPPPAQ